MLKCIMRQVKYEKGGDKHQGSLYRSGSQNENRRGHVYISELWHLVVEPFIPLTLQTLHLERKFWHSTEEYYLQQMNVCTGHGGPLHR